MKCPHCAVEIYAEAIWVPLEEDSEGQWGIEKYLCPNPVCNKMIFYLVMGSYKVNSRGSLIGFDEIQKRFLVNPKGSNRPPVPPQVPQKLADDYVEACKVLPDSPKASAALSRRCLQNVLREKAKVKPRDLAKEIQEVIDSGTLPSYLVEEIDAVRNIGNFAAHPLKSEKSGEILPVEPTEAEWNLDVLEALFDFYFVQPDAARKKKAALNQKLKEAGKKPMK